MKYPLPHQQEAINKAIEYFKIYSRGKMIMPCGSGKTLTSLWIAKNLNANHIIIALPSLQLQSQTIEAWINDIADTQNSNFFMLGISSDKKIANDFEIEVSTEKEIIRNFILDNCKNKTVIFTTYHSSYLLEEALEGLDFVFDFVIFDEAHHTAGIDKVLFHSLLNNKNYFIKNRLFMTATPKVLAGKNSSLIKSMDDEKTYGKEFYRLSIRQAIDSGIISPYKVATFYVTNEDIVKYISENVVLNDFENELSSEKIRIVASAISLCKAIVEYNLKKIIAYHSSIEKSLRFEAIFEKIAQIFGINHINIYHLDGTFSSNKRDKKIESFVNDKLAVITNAKLLNEGFDVPSVDAVIFVDERNSATDIVQASGRAWRRSEGKDFGYIIIPCVVSDENEVDSKELRSLRRTFSILSGQDEQLSAYFSGIPQYHRNNSIVEHQSLSINLNIEELIDNISVKVWENVSFLYWMSLEDAQNWVNDNLVPIGIDTFEKWKLWINGDIQNAPERPKNMPKYPWLVYKLKWTEFINKKFNMTLEEAIEWNFKNLQPLTSLVEFEQLQKSGLVPSNMSQFEQYRRLAAKNGKRLTYKDFIPVLPAPTYNDFKNFVKKLEPTVHNSISFKKYLKGDFIELPEYPKNFPKRPDLVYENFSWKDILDSLDDDFEKHKSFIQKELVPLGINMIQRYEEYFQGKLEGPDKPKWLKKKIKKLHGFTSYADVFMNSSLERGNYKKHKEWVQKYLVPIGIDNSNKYQKYYAGQIEKDLPQKPEWLKKSIKDLDGFISLEDFFEK